MRATFIIAAALVAAPASAQRDEADPGALTAAADGFFAALRSPDKSALRPVMHPDGVIIIHSRMDNGQPALRVLTNADYLKGHEARTIVIDEVMHYEAVLIDGGMGHVWGPYRFLVAGETSHCGINSMSFAKAEDGRWQVTNTSFTMEPPGECERLGAPETPPQ